LLAGAGVAHLLGRVRVASRPRWAAASLVLLALIGLGGMLRDLVRPYKTTSDDAVRRLVAALFREARPEDQIVVLTPRRKMSVTSEWYLRQEPGRVSWERRIDWERLPPQGQLWCLDCSQCTRAPARPWPTSSPPGRQLVLLGHQRHVHQMGKSEETVERFEIFRWKCLPATEDGVAKLAGRR
jgi:hypothetical protein